MTGWVVRAIGMCLVNVGVRILLGVAVTQWPLQGSQLRWLGLAAVLLIVIVWAGLDGIRDRRAHPDPDDSSDLTMVWLKTAVFAGLVAGLAAWLIQLLVDFSMGRNSLFFELTSGAAFTILLIFIPATAAVFLGRLLANGEAKKKLAEQDEQRDKQRHDRHLVGSGSGSHDQNVQSRHEDVRHDDTRGAGTQWSGDNADTEVFDAVDPDAGDPRTRR